MSVWIFRFMFSIICSLFTVRSLVAWMGQFMGMWWIKFSPNDNPSLTSLEKTNGAPRWCFNITNYLGVPGKGTDVALRMRMGWGAGQGHHTPRLGSDKHGWLGVFPCPQAIKGGVDRDSGTVARGVGEGRGTEVQHRHMPGLHSCSKYCCQLGAVAAGRMIKIYILSVHKVKNPLHITCAI